MNHRRPTTSRLMMKYIIEYYESQGKYPLNADIARRFVVSQPCVTQIMDRLEEKGYIKRKKSKIIGVGKTASDFVKGLIH